MSLTTAQLDAYCGGAPTETRRCHRAGCHRVVGPYYSPALARDAIAQHARWVHATEDSRMEPSTQT